MVTDRARVGVVGVMKDPFEGVPGRPIGKCAVRVDVGVRGIGALEVDFPLCSSLSS